MRDPSLHITYSSFLQIADECDLNLSESQIKKIFAKGRGRAAVTRVISSKNQRVMQKVDKLSASNSSDTDLLAQVIYAVQMKLKFIGAKKIRQSDAQWSTLKQLTEMLNDYCKMTNQKNKKQAYTEFVLKGMQTANNRVTNTISYLKNSFEKITQLLEAERLLREDPSPDSTSEMHYIFTSKVAEMTGIASNYHGNTLDYIAFYYGKLLADELKIDYETFIDAQFDALAFCNGIPNIHDLYSEKAEERLTRYLSRNGLTLRAKSQNRIKVDWSKFKI